MKSQADSVRFWTCSEQPNINRQSSLPVCQEDAPSVMIVFMGLQSFIAAAK